MEDTDEVIVIETARIEIIEGYNAAGEKCIGTKFSTPEGDLIDMVTGIGLLGYAKMRFFQRKQGEE